jgi:hypothetical protein
MADSSKSSSSDKWKYSLISSIIFLIVAAPMTYKLVDSVTKMVKIDTVDSSGCSTMMGLVIHAIVFLLISRLIMEWM